MNGEMKKLTKAVFNLHQINFHKVTCVSQIVQYEHSAITEGSTNTAQHS